MSDQAKTSERGGLSPSELGGLAVSYALVFVIGIVVGIMLATSGAATEASGRPEASGPSPSARASASGSNGASGSAGPEGSGGESGPSAEQIERLRARAEARPEDASAHVALGNALFDTDKYERAAEAYRRALELDPKQPDVLVDRGICFRRTGDPERAVEAFERAIEIDPDHANAHFNLGLVASHDLGNRKRGIEAWQRYLEIAPDSPHADRVRRAIEILRRRSTGNDAASE